MAPRRRPRVLNRRVDGIPPGAVYVGRPSPWGNPFEFPSSLCPTREDAIERFRYHMTEGQGSLLDLRPLRGKDLVCWCAPLPCHADILLEMANASKVIDLRRQK